MANGEGWYKRGVNEIQMNNLKIHSFWTSDVWEKIKSKHRNKENE